MDVLYEGDASAYCTGNFARREEFWQRAQMSNARPAFLLPIFELCRAIHFGARNGKRFDIGAFRDCWQDLVDTHEALAPLNAGCLVRLLDGGADTSDNLPLDVWSYADVSEDSGDEEPLLRDPRDRFRDPRPFRECFRALGGCALEDVYKESALAREWSYTLPELPGRELNGRVPTDANQGDLVLDTNFFVDLLDELPEDGHLTAMPCQHGHPAAKLGGAIRRFQNALKTRGRSGKLIVPSAVLIETFGIVRKKNPANHANADLVMKAMEVGGSDWPLWEAFAFRGLSVEVLDAYLFLHEEMAQRVPEADRWPDFTDAFVLAHGLVEACPVISGEWRQKEDWDQVGKMFPYLFCR
ncbi:MAG: hypothetical protein ABI134_19075 [Byssovorax sp.]